MSMNSLIIGRGEVGKALHAILTEHYPTASYDPATDQSPLPSGGEPVDVMHICFPFSDNFVSEVKRYQKLYQPRYTVIHSTVPVGTSAACEALHSPIRGIHPHLEQGIRTFPKFIGGPRASEVADYFRRAGLSIILCDSAEATELGKLLDTEYYRACIEFTQRAKQLCDEHHVNFHEAYTLFNQTYNSGYASLGHPEFIRPVLQPIMTPIGGHCILPNKELLKSPPAPLDSSGK